MITPPAESAGSEVVERAPGITAAAWGALGACLIAVFMQMLDLTIVNTALPSISEDIDAPGSAQVLVVTLYSLTFACSLMTAARIGDLVGRRRMFSSAIVAFVLASVWCGLAGGATELVVARGFQGVAAAAMSAQTIAIISHSFPKAKQPIAFGIYAAASGLAAVIGPMLGGVIIAMNPFGLGWHAIFLLNVPLGLIGFVLARRYLHVGRQATHERLDLVGVALSMAGTLLVIYPLAVGRENGWAPGYFVLLGVGVLVLTVFVVQQRWYARTGAIPLLRGELFRDRTFLIGAITTAVFFGMFAGFLFTVSVTAQDGLHFTAMRTGLTMAPFAVGAVIGAVGSPFVVARLGRRAATVGVGLFAIGITCVAATITPSDATVSLRELSGSVFLAGMGMGLLVSALPALMLSRVEEQTTGSASGIVPTIQQIGSAVGLAAISVLFFHQVGGATPESTERAGVVLAQRLTESGVPAGSHASAVDGFTECARRALTAPAPRLRADTCVGSSAVGAADLDAAGRQAAGQTFLGAFTLVLWVVAALSFATTVLTLWLPRASGSRA
ncbi:MFS transporter [Nocardia callitridis]|uniref:MFS transporter n=1 Tax=Nocardia callitridis TaxID=648753 RepID=A0ABP9KMC3_9NOCA